MFEQVTLEVSLKPFKQTDEAYIRRVCADIFDQWRPLIKNRRKVSVMLWTADGSEILDYSGDLDQPFEWCCYMGSANAPLIGEGEDESTNLHHRKHFYMDNPPVMTYRILKFIVSALKEAGKAALPHAEICVGETFDIGPEFAVSDFKYTRHREICSGSVLDHCGFVDATALLNGDDRPYAAYPHGIPHGTPFGTFLGRQANVFLRDMGFDYLWLSNGLGFSANPWDVTGKIFDGKQFYPERLADTRQKVFEFWRLFREGCPDVPLMVRGTNNSVGIDYATDGVPLYDIYHAGFDIAPPPNSPWAALTDNYGLEIMGHMTRICDLPSEEFLFRYYLHDPWWQNSPWYDRYDGCPTDIYLPMAISRIDRAGNTRTATMMNILSIDNSKGGMPDACVYEPLPHFLKAEKDAADEPAPLVWVYPMREYTAADGEEWLSEMYFGDTYISQAINHGLPLNCVVASDYFLEHPLSLYQKSVLISPVQPNKAVWQRVAQFAAAGGRVLLYGSAQRLAAVADIENVQKVDVASSPNVLREALAAWGYVLDFNMKESAPKPPAMTVARSDNGLFFSAYLPDTTTEIAIGTPLGAPVLMGGECELREGLAHYRFNRGEHRECRVFVQQQSGVIGAHESQPCNAKYRRRIKVTGLSDATVVWFPEKYCDQNAIVTTVPADDLPVPEAGWEPFDDPRYGYGYRAEHVTGTRYLMMPFPGKTV